MRISRDEEGEGTRKSRYTEQQIRLAVQQAEAGPDPTEICCKNGVSQATFYRWLRKYGALSGSELEELEELKKENSRLKKIVADLTLDKQVFRDVLSKKHCGPRVDVSR